MANFAFDLSTLSNLSVAGSGAEAGLGNSNWTANLAVYTPFRVPVSTLVKKLWWKNGFTSGGQNGDIGIYDVNGLRLVASGSTATSGSNAVQAINITDIDLPPGLYYLGLAFDSTASYTNYGSNLSLPLKRMFGMAQEASAFPLPAVATFAVFSTASFGIPFAGFTGFGVI